MLKKTCRLQQLEILESRGGLDEAAARDLWSERIGFTGESGAYHFMQDRGQAHWEILHDTWVQINGKSQVDLIVATLSDIYMFEIKYYSGQYSYSKSQQYIDNKPIKGNLFVSFKAANVKMSELLQTIGYSGHLYSKVVFFNPDYPVIVDDEWNHSVLMRNQFLPFIQQMSQDERTSPRANISPSEFCRLVKRDFTGPHPYPPRAYSHAEILKLKGGFVCQECHSVAIDVSRYKVSCGKCHSYREDKSIAVVRAVCEYGVLRASEPFRANDIFEFLGYSVSKSTIARALRKYFVLVPNSHYLYQNPGMNYEYFKEGLIVKVDR